MTEKINILISIDEEFADILYYLKKQIYGRKKGAQSKTIEDALLALAREEKFESALKKIECAQKEMKDLQKEIKSNV